MHLCCKRIGSAEQTVRWALMGVPTSAEGAGGCDCKATVDNICLTMAPGWGCKTFSESPSQQLQFSFTFLLLHFPNSL